MMQATPILYKHYVCTKKEGVYKVMLQRSSCLFWTPLPDGTVPSKLVSLIICDGSKLHSFFYTVCKTVLPFVNLEFSSMWKWTLDFEEERKGRILTPLKFGDEDNSWEYHGKPHPLNCQTNRARIFTWGIVDQLKLVREVRENLSGENVATRICKWHFFMGERQENLPVDIPSYGAWCYVSLSCALLLQVKGP